MWPPIDQESRARGDRSLFEYTDKGQDGTAHRLAREDGNIQAHPFKFDKVFDPSCSQEIVPEDISALVQSAPDDYGVYIFAYGQTGSGKTYTMLD